MPYVVGDIYGDPNEGELAPVTLKPDLSFSLDLNKSHEKLAAALVPTEFSQKWMTIEPAAARVARLSPFVLPVGRHRARRHVRVDRHRHRRQAHAGVLRPAGAHPRRNRLRRPQPGFDIESKEAGYVWIRQPEGSGEFRMAPWPGRVLLAVMPK